VGEKWAGTQRSRCEVWEIRIEVWSKKPYACLSSRHKAADSQVGSATCTPCLIGNDVPDSTHQPLRMFAGVHKHSQSRHATAEGIETVDEITGEGGRGLQQHGVGGGGGFAATRDKGRW
jgi:hypothetical protein